MSSEAITRNDLKAILNAVLPLSKFEHIHQTGTITLPATTTYIVHQQVFTEGSWLILTTSKPTNNGSGTTVNAGQNRILKDGSLLYAQRGQFDVSVVLTNHYFLENASNTTIALELYKSTTGSANVDWTFTAIRVPEATVGTSQPDYVVEQGTSGIWTYRKWNSGVSECWGSVSTSTSFTVWVSPIYYGSTYSAAQTFPTGLFINAPLEQVTMYSSKGDVWVGAPAGSGVSATTTGRYYPVRAGNLTATATYVTRFYDIGRWK